MDAGDEAEKLRDDDDEWKDQASRRPQQADNGAPTVVAKTTKVNTYPTSAQAFYAMTPLGLLGKAVEAGAFTATNYGKVFYAANIGSTVPAIGDYVVCTFIGNRWVFRYDG